MLIIRGARGPISVRRMRAVAAVVVSATLLVLLEHTSWALFPHEQNSTMAGVAAGAAYFGLAVYLYSYVMRDS